MFACEFCKKEFTIKGNLISHQKTAKYCLEKQGKNLSEEFKCDHCNKVFTLKTNLNDHINICKSKKIKEKEYNDDKIIKDHNDKIKKIKDEYENEKSYYQREHNKEIELLNQVITKLEAKLESYEKRLFDMASRPNTTNTNNNHDN